MFSYISSTFWNLFPFKGDFSFGKSQMSQGTKSGFRGAESPGWFDVSQKNCTRCDVWVDALLWWSCQSLVAHSCGILNYSVVSMEEYSSFTQNLMHICCSTCSVILNAMATQYTCSFSGIYHPHWLVQWSHHCSCMHIPVHSPWLPGYIDVKQIILVMLTIAGLFPDRPLISL